MLMNVSKGSIKMVITVEYLNNNCEMSTFGFRLIYYSAFLAAKAM